MNKIIFSISVIGLAILISCKSTDFSNPEDVIKNYRILSRENRDEKLYDDFLSIKSKEFVTKDEYVKKSSVPDSTLKVETLLDRKISAYPVDVNAPTYRRFKVDEKCISNKDTVNFRRYYTLINENGKWKIVWTGTLLSFADKKFFDGNYSEARKTLEKIIEIDPFSGDAYRALAWCYIRDTSLPLNESENGCMKNAKYALQLEEDNPSSYNTLATYYSSIGNSDLAIQSLERGLPYCQSKYVKAVLLSNLCMDNMRIGRFEKAEEYINMSLQLDKKKASSWFHYGLLMYEQGKIDRAIGYFNKALTKKKMENVLQGILFYKYALCCRAKNNYKIARKYAIKALDIEPNNDAYQKLYNSIEFDSLFE
jgi:tetratricopeptide (TPR) repeat protein